MGFFLRVSGNVCFVLVMGSVSIHLSAPWKEDIRTSSTMHCTLDFICHRTYTRVSKRAKSMEWRLRWINVQVELNRTSKASQVFFFFFSSNFLWFYYRRTCTFFFLSLPFSFWFSSDPEEHSLSATICWHPVPSQEGAPFPTLIPPPHHSPLSRRLFSTSKWSYLTQRERKREKTFNSTSLVLVLSFSLCLRLLFFVVSPSFFYIFVLPPSLLLLPPFCYCCIFVGRLFRGHYPSRPTSLIPCHPHTRTGTHAAPPPTKKRLWTSVRPIRPLLFYRVPASFRSLTTHRPSTKFASKSLYSAQQQRRHLDVDRTCIQIIKTRSNSTFYLQPGDLLVGKTRESLCRNDDTQFLSVFLVFFPVSLPFPPSWGADGTCCVCGRIRRPSRYPHFHVH